MQRITIHCLSHASICRTSWLLTELGMNFDVKRYVALPAALMAHHAAATQLMTPSALVEIDGEVFRDSPATLQWLALQNPRAIHVPAITSIEYARYCHLLHFAEDMPAFFDMAESAALPILEKWGLSDAPSLDRTMTRFFDQLDAVLGRNAFLLEGGFSAADIQIAAFLHVANILGLLDEREELAEYLERMEDRPAFGAARRIARPASPWSHSAWMQPDYDLQSACMS